MTQIGTVTALPGGDGQVELTVRRQSACGHDCAGCGGCAGQELVIHARTDIPLALGDRVEVYSGGRVLGIAALVYLGPVALFLLGYLLSAGAAEAARYLWGGAGFALGLAGAAVCDRRLRKRRAVTYRVTRKL
ncbi:MAG: SoxR reducing system RseC family protein [Oscillospiraceae bacterium]|jgi:sigma-E factor negative regulatory protein RseC|nr:SoxR reducing system RseC family protein [Oscillospiraceae bacterium]